MSMDFNNCKTKEDVEKIFKENERELRIIKAFNNSLRKVKD